VHGLVLRTLVAQHALRESDLLDARGSDLGVAVTHEVLDQVLAARVFHPRQCDVGREVVVLGLEAVLLDELRFDGLVELCEFGAPVADAEPEDGDVLQAREHAQAAKFRVEGLDAGVGDGRLQALDELVSPRFLDVAEELHGDVGLGRVHEVQSRRLRELGLQVLDTLREFVGQVDADEQPHTGGSECVALNSAPPITNNMTDPEDADREDVADLDDEDADVSVGDHDFSEGQGFDEPYEGLDLDPPELDVDPSQVDPVDSRAVADLVDERVVQNDDVDADELIDVGMSYLGIKSNEEAADTFERAARFADDEDTEQEAWVNKAIAHGELEEWDAAVGAGREAIFVAEDGDFEAEAHTNLSYALWEMGEDEQAYDHAEKAVRADERLPHAWYNLGFIENERGRNEAALDALDNAIRLGFKQADVYEEKTRALEELGREEEAAEVAEHAEDLRERQEQELVDG
jgi:tetratricopeptide (TPR) repeat protein